VEGSTAQAFLLADLVAGFTALTEAHGNAKATELAEYFAVGAVWAVVLALHYRAVRRVL
jgi:hypothetical protein